MTADDALHVVSMVLHDNQGNRLTEALCLGIKDSVAFYLADLTRAEAAMNVKIEGDSHAQT